MPVILKRENENRWLSGDAPAADQMKMILLRYPSHEMDAYPDSLLVNSPEVDDEQLFDRLLLYVETASFVVDF
jgi:putative SOS response-associated peptidase YedK